MVPKFKKKGRKRRLSIALTKELNLLIKDFIQSVDKKSMREFYRELQEKATTLGLPAKTITYETMRREIMRYKEQFKSNSKIII